MRRETKINDQDDYHMPYYVIFVMSLHPLVYKYEFVPSSKTACLMLPVDTRS